MSDVVVAAVTPADTGERAALLLSSYETESPHNVAVFCMAAGSPGAAHEAVHELVDSCHCDTLVLFGDAARTAACDEESYEEIEKALSGDNPVVCWMGQYPQHRTKIIVVSVPDSSDSWWQESDNHDEFISLLNGIAEHQIEHAVAGMDELLKLQMSPWN